MVDYFNLLGQSVELTVVFEQKNSDLQKTRWNKFDFKFFTGHLLNGISLNRYGAFSSSVVKYIKREYDFVFVTNPLTPTGILAIMYMRFKKYKYVIESEGGFPGSGSGIKELIKRTIISNAFYYFSGNSTSDEYFKLYGADKNRLYRYPFSSVFEKDIIIKLLTYKEKQAYRVNHNIYGEKAIVGIGRFIESKNWEWLIDEWKRMKSSYHLYIIGEGKLKAKLLNKINLQEINNIHILDYIEHSRLLELITYFDLLVHPTLSDVWGLTINEGMARGLPIVSSNYCLAALEMIDNGVNGYVCELDRYFIKNIEEILSNEKLAEKISMNNLVKISDYTIEQMVTSHLRFFENQHFKSN
jgi:glycosyltransferase involved in cell wall biosynthesis